MNIQADRNFLISLSLKSHKGRLVDLLLAHIDVIRVRLYDGLESATQINIYQRSRGKYRSMDYTEIEIKVKFLPKK